MWQPQPQLQQLWWLEPGNRWLWQWKQLLLSNVCSFWYHHLFLFLLSLSVESLQWCKHPVLALIVYWEWCTASTQYLLLKCVSSSISDKSQISFSSAALVTLFIESNCLSLILFSHYSNYAILSTFYHLFTLLMFTQVLISWILISLSFRIAVYWTTTIGKGTHYKFNTLTGCSGCAVTVWSLAIADCCFSHSTLLVF